jgi:hypothetical protein
MRLHLEHKFKDELTPQELERMEELRLLYGMMWNLLQETEGANVILAKKGSEIVGWGLIAFHRKQYEFHIYVSRFNRREGIGTKIFDLASKIYHGGLWISKWNDESEAFYDAVENE